MTKPSQFPETFAPLDPDDVLMALKGMPVSPAEHKITVQGVRDSIFKAVTQAEYDALSPPVEGILYLIVDP
jgi:hypothetical protein